MFLMVTFSPSTTMSASRAPSSTSSPVKFAKVSDPLAQRSDFLSGNARCFQHALPQNSTMMSQGSREEDDGVFMMHAVNENQYLLQRVPALRVLSPKSSAEQGARNCQHGISSVYDEQVCTCHWHPLIQRRPLYAYVLSMAVHHTRSSTHRGLLESRQSGFAKMFPCLMNPVFVLSRYGSFLTS